MSEIALPAVQPERPLHRLAQQLARLAWVVFLLAIPITSFPYFPEAMGGGALVRPLLLYPLTVLVVLTTLPRLFTQPLPKTLLSLGPFILAAVASSLLSLTRGVEPALGISMEDRVLRALITLAIGIAIYLTTALVPRSLEELRASLRWMYVGFGLALAWGSIQVVNVVHFNPAFFQLLNQVQRHISTRKLIQNRVSGPTYEPNWFGEQLSVLLLPWLLASVVSGQTVFHWRWKWLTIEWLLLLWTMAVLPFTFSRGALLNLGVMIVLALALYRREAARRESRPVSPRRIWLTRTLAAGLVITLALGVGYVATRRNQTFSRIWTYWSKPSANLAGYFDYIGFGARFVYGEAAINTYQDHPIFGVGLGNYAFYFEQNLPERSLAAMPEVLRLITPDEGRNRLITSKNLYLRLLAETGLVGTAAFMAFLVAVSGCTLYLILSPLPKQRFWGIGAVLSLIVFILSAFSFDSFALPNMWISLGLITASAWVFSHPLEGMDLAGAVETTGNG
jgi:hypothetical protein